MPDPGRNGSTDEHKIEAFFRKWLRSEWTLLFKEVIRENIDLCRPEQVQLIFSRKLKRSTVVDGRCRTRIINEGVIPSLRIYYKNTQSKQYHKAERDARDCALIRRPSTPNDFRRWPAYVQPACIILFQDLGSRKVTVDYETKSRSSDVRPALDRAQGEHCAAGYCVDPRITSVS